MSCNPDIDQKDLQLVISRIELLLIRREICMLKSKSENELFSPIRKERQFRFSVSNRIKFQRKMNKLNSSPNLLAAEEKRYHCPIETCDSVYKLKGALKNHLLKVHGITSEDSSLSESKFEPSATSTADNMCEEDAGRKRKYESESESEVEENLEEARKAKETRREVIEQLNVERDLHLGYDAEETGYIDDTLIGPQIVDTQTLLNGLTESVKKAEAGSSKDSVIMMGDDSLSMSITNNNVELKAMTDKVKHLEQLLENMDSKVTDLQIENQELKHSMDEKDKMLKEKRMIIKIKQQEIDEHIRDKKEQNSKVKKSPMKEVMKTEIEKASRQISHQTARIKNLEAQNVELSKHVKHLEEDRPDVNKLRKTASECLDRAEYYTVEKEELINEISHLRKKIPCKNITTCDKGKRCMYSHILKYTTKESNTKRVPCLHFINNRCKYEDSECDFSHDEALLSGKQRRQYLDARRSLLEDLSEISEEEEEEVRAEYSRSANRYKPASKRMRLGKTSDRESSNNTDNFPEPVPAISRQTSRSSRGSRGSRTSGYSAAPSTSSNNKGSGNAKGAHARRSSVVSPSRPSGPQKNRRRNSSTRHSPTAGRRTSTRWDRETPKSNSRGSSRNSRGGSNQDHRRRK